MTECNATEYYYETEHNHGFFLAENDNDAMKKMPEGTLVLYKESCSLKNNIPFIIVFEKYKYSKKE